MAGSVIQATGTVEFKNGLWVGNQLKAQNGLQKIHTIPGVLSGAVFTPRFFQGKTEFQSAEVYMTAWCQSRTWI